MFILSREQIEKIFKNLYKAFINWRPENDWEIAYRVRLNLDKLNPNQVDVLRKILADVTKDAPNETIDAMREVNRLRHLWTEH